MLAQQKKGTLVVNKIDTIIVTSMRNPKHMVDDINTHPSNHCITLRFNFGKCVKLSYNS